MSHGPAGQNLESPRRRKGELFGHPKGLYVLFFTELWERFSFYGMKTLLILYMTNYLFWTQEDASSLLGTYAMLAYGVPVLGGLVADHLLGARRSVILGAVLLSAGHITMAFEGMVFFYTALGLIIAGVGLLKPNISTQVGSLYKPGDPRRDGAFTIFYMGINLGALFGPLICDWLRVHYGWEYGFGAAGVGMIFGLIVYVIGQRGLIEYTQDVEDELASEAEDAGGAAPGARAEHPPHVIRDRVLVLLIVFAFVILFWTAFEQSANVMIVWADKHTNLRLASTEVEPIVLEGVETVTEMPGEETGWSERFTDWWSDPRMTSGQTQSFNPFFIIALSPLFAWFWLWLDRRGKQPSTPTKMVIGLALVVAAYGAMVAAAQSESELSTVRLDELPDRVDLSDYGAKRLHYNPETRTLHMGGVLPDLDRLRLLGASAPEEFSSRLNALVFISSLDSEMIKLIGLLVADADQRPAEPGSDEEWELSKKLPSAPEGFEIVGEEAPKVAQWDPDTETLTVTGEINDRAKAELLAAAADPAFKAAVDELYVSASLHRVTVWWLILFYMLLTMGELCLSPVGLSLVTKLAPPRHVGVMMGGWFLATAIAEKLAQVFGGMWGQMNPTKYFFVFIIMCGAGAALMALLIPRLKRMMHGVH